MIRVAHCILGYFPQLGGAENQARLLIKQLVERSIKVTVFTRKYTGYTETDSSANLDIVRSWKAIGIGSKEFSSVIIALRLMFRRREFDILHVHQLNVLAFFVTLVGVITNRPVVIKVANSGQKFDFNTLAKKPLGKFMAFCIKNSDARFIALSEPVSDMLQKSGICSSRIRIIPNGVQPAAVVEPRRIISNIGFIGRLEKVKRPDIFLELCKRLPELNFHVFGDGSLREQLESDAIASGLNNLKFHGNLYDTNLIYPNLDMIVHPSESEGMSNALLESIAFGLRCVVNSIPENLALFGNCSSIVEYVQGYDLDSWVIAIQKVQQKTYESVLLDRQHLLQKFKIENVADSYLNLYESLLDE